MGPDQVRRVALEHGTQQSLSSRGVFSPVPALDLGVPA
jgi:hypothetical protein